MVDYDNYLYYSVLQMALRQQFWQRCVHYCIVVGIYYMQTTVYIGRSFVRALRKDESTVSGLQCLVVCMVRGEKRWSDRGHN